MNELLLRRRLMLAAKGNTPINYLKFIAFTANENNSVLGLANRSTNQTVFEYSTDGTVWEDFNTGVTVDLNSGETVYVRGKLTGVNESSNYTQFETTSGKFSFSGNINSLWNYEDFGQTLYEYCGYKLFSGCTGLISADELVLPATTLADKCYQFMFEGCTSLTTAPELPATTLATACYTCMFDGCTSLTTAPELPATALTNSCYEWMFDGCTSLTNAPELPATELANYCYDDMFRGCTSLKVAPNLPATILADYCYRLMFFNCSNLVTPPIISATTAAEYSCYGMFESCPKLTYTPDLTHITVLGNGCFYSMFYNCTSLTTVTELPATTLAYGCYSYMFSKCTSLRVAQTILPATVLPGDPNYAGVAGYNLRWDDEIYNGVYLGMFYGCKNLEVAPILPAKQLTTSCYHSMFYSCTKLIRTIILATNIQDQHVSDYIDNLNEIVHEKLGPSTNADPVFLKKNTPTIWLDHSNNVTTRKFAIPQEAYDQWCQIMTYYTHIFPDNFEIITPEEINEIIERYHIVYDD